MPEPTYRLIGQPAAQTTAPATQPKQPAAPGKPAPVDAEEVLNTEATAEQELEAIVNEERRDRVAEDLLTGDAPTE